MKPKTLKFYFYCSTSKKVGNRIKPIIKNGVHLVADDGCKQNLEKTTKDLSEAQQWGVDVSVNPRTKKHLLYLNTKIISNVRDEKGNIKVNCPVCKTKYIIIKKEYDEVYDKFLEGDEIKD